VEALTAGSELMPSVRTALVGLERERERLERDLAAAQSRDVTSPGGIEEIVNELVAALASLREVLESGGGGGAEGGGADVPPRCHDQQEGGPGEEGGPGDADLVPPSGHSECRS